LLRRDIRRKDNPMRSTAAQQRAHHFAEFRQQYEQDEQERRGRRMTALSAAERARRAKYVREARAAALNDESTVLVLLVAAGR
jgi:hypothetical protein